MWSLENNEGNKEVQKSSEWLTYEKLQQLRNEAFRKKVAENAKEKSKNTWDSDFDKKMKELRAQQMQAAAKWELWNSEQVAYNQKRSESWPSESWNNDESKLMWEVDKAWWMKDSEITIFNSLNDPKDRADFLKAVLFVADNQWSYSGNEKLSSDPREAAKQIKSNSNKQQA